ncbi:hypothetical protein ACIPSA_11395 [Streptomyces sp. NPDC086549]|uniref:hypothetical protein n=1 Tax=Streptomyces sp. NPDC086549 TaxID=3365752 RepID=UPI00380C6AE8
MTRMRAKARHYSIVVVDIERFGSRTNPVQQWLRDRLYELVDEALDETGVDRAAAPPPSDRGDGFFWLLPGDVDKVDLTGRFVGLLHDKLRAHSMTSNAEGAMRLRVALHSGDVAWDGRGWQGEELNTACRLVDLPALRAVLTEAVRAQVALAVTGDWYRRVIQQDYPEVERAAFRRVPFDAKEIRGESAWIRVPGYDTPPGTPPPDESDGDGPDDLGPRQPGGPTAQGEQPIGVYIDVKGPVAGPVGGDLTVQGDFRVDQSSGRDRDDLDRSR